MVTRSTPLPLEQRLRAARPAVPSPSPQAVARLHARLRAEVTPHPTRDLALALTLGLSAAGMLTLWWALGGPWARLYAWLYYLSQSLGTLAWWWEHGLWLPFLVVLLALSVGTQALIAGLVARRLCQRMLCRQTWRPA